MSESVSVSEAEPHVAQPATGILMTASIAVTVWWWMGGDVTVLTLDFRVWSEPWRLFTPVLPHIDVFHLFFNLYWLYVFGGKVETVFGSYKTTAIYLLLGIGSSLAQYSLFRSGVGLSGIGYGLFGFLWVLSRNDLRFSNAINHQVVQLFIGWFILCVVLSIADVWQVGNVAHGAGAVLGCVLGWCVVARASNTRLASRLLLGGIMGGLIVAASIGRPYLNLTGAVWDEYSYFGYQALLENNPAQAVWYLEKAVAMRPGVDKNWYNLGVAYFRCDRWDEAITAYRRAIALSPTVEVYQTTLNELEQFMSANR